MIFRQYYLECLSHASYLVGDSSTGRAVVVDPQRDIAAYLADAAAEGLTIERVIETHFHADFLSGHLELAAATGAVISYGEAAAGRPEYPVEYLRDGQLLSLGEVNLHILATPGHTPESISVVVYERADDDVPYGVLTGDTLFIGDVGRPDLLTSLGVTAEELARQLHHSLTEKLLPLPDATRVFPAHGAGSACGKNLSTETQSTMGEQRRTNYALAPMSHDEFVAVVTEDQPPAPPYFIFSAVTNSKERALLDEASAPPVLSLDDVLAAQRAGATVLDTRPPAVFARGHLVGSINVGLDGRFAEYAGNVIRPDQPVVLVSDPGTATEARLRLARIGFDNVVGSLAEPEAAFLARPDLVHPSAAISAVELAERLGQRADVQLVDVRNDSEARLGSIPGAVAIPLARLTSRLAELDPARPTVVNCAGGYRSSIGASVLRANGFADVSDLLGGYAAWAAVQLPTASASA
jgi:glyoxylase-like metal-dependent hydrolase (beta-lactamase superfamily II)/rhodanese-related sulfurtransferase